MGYTRDRDAATRGAGAIAARACGLALSAAVRADRRRHALALRDWALSHMTYGNRGGIALGAISKASAGILQNMMAPTIKTGGSIEVPPQLKQNLVQFDPRPPMPPVRPPIMLPPLPPKPRPPKNIRDFTSVVQSKGSVASAIDAILTPTVMVDPVRAPNGNTGVVPPKTTKPPGVITGGGGGGVGLPPRTNGNTGIVPPDFGPLPDVPDDAPDASSKPSSNKTLLIAGAAALGAYLLFGRKKGA